MTRFVRKILTISLCTLSVLLPTGCHGVFDDIYDSAPADLEFSEGFHPGSSPQHLVLMLNCTDYGEWIYVDFKQQTLQRRPIPDALAEGETWDGVSGLTYHIVEGDRYTQVGSVATSPQPEPEQWDMAFHHYDVRTNGGAVAESPVSDIFKAVAKGYAALEFVPDTFSERQVIVDLREMMGFKIGYQNIVCNPVMSQWVKMDISTPPPSFAASGHTYFVRMAGGETAAMHLHSYVSERGTKGYLTIDIIYPL